MNKKYEIYLHDREYVGFQSFIRSVGKRREIRNVDVGKLARIGRYARQAHAMLGGNFRGDERSGRKEKGVAALRRRRNKRVHFRSVVSCEIPR